MHVDPLNLELQMGMRSSILPPDNPGLLSLSSGLGQPPSWVGFQLLLIGGASWQLGLFRSYEKRSPAFNGHH